MSDEKRSARSEKGGIDRRGFLRGLAAASGAVALGGAVGRTGANGATPRRPNVIFILADDLGWMDTGAYGSRYYETPNIDRLAERGIMFTDAYSANPLCSPTRASCMTGKYPARLGITTPAGHLPAQPDRPLLPDTAPAYQKVILPRSKRYLPLEEYTLGEAMRDAGYRTAFFGKWHLGHDPKYWPEHQGFDLNIGGGRWPGPPSYFAPYRITNLPDGSEGEHITDRLTNEALAYIQDNRNTPFFMCFWHYSVHAPYQAKKEYIQHFRDKQDPRDKQDNPIMGSMIKSLDDSVGRVIDKLDELDLRRDTIVVFFSDNGGNEYDRIGEDKMKPTNNDPLRKGKGSIYEGGVRVPFIVNWPGVVPPRSTSSELVMSMDLYPTILQMAGASPKTDQTIDGVSLVPVLRGAGDLERDALFCHMPHHVSPPTGALSAPCTWVRKGPWKLIRFYDTNDEFPNDYELYNLEQDIGETNNLADEMPRTVTELDALIDGFLSETGAIVPKPNPAYRPDARRTIAGWRASGTCWLSATGGTLSVHSTGGDPYFLTNDVPAADGELTVKLRMQSDSDGGGSIYWTTTKERRFWRTRRVGFQPNHDGNWHEYEIEFTANAPLTGLRIDPSTAEGTMRIERIALFDRTDSSLRTWTFTD